MTIDHDFVEAVFLTPPVSKEHHEEILALAGNTASKEMKPHPEFNKREPRIRTDLRPVPPTPFVAVDLSDHVIECGGPERPPEMPRPLPRRRDKTEPVNMADSPFPGVRHKDFHPS